MSKDYIELNHMAEYCDEQLPVITTIGEGDAGHELNVISPIGNEEHDSLPILSTIGRGPKGDGITAEVLDTGINGEFKFVIKNDAGVVIFTSANLAAGDFDFSQDTVPVQAGEPAIGHFTKTIAGTTEQYQVIIPPGEKGTYIFVVTAEQQDNGIYTAPVSSASPKGIAPRLNDAVIFTGTYPATNEDSMCIGYINNIIDENLFFYPRYWYPQNNLFTDEINSINNAINILSDEINSKVDKIDGYYLSSNDFVSSLKESILNDTIVWCDDIALYTDTYISQLNQDWVNSQSVIGSGLESDPPGAAWLDNGVAKVKGSDGSWVPVLSYNLDKPMFGVLKNHPDKALWKRVNEHEKRGWKRIGEAPVLDAYYYSINNTHDAEMIFCSSDETKPFTNYLINAIISKDDGYGYLGDYPAGMLPTLDGSSVNILFCSDDTGSGYYAAPGSVEWEPFVYNAANPAGLLLKKEIIAGTTLTRGVNESFTWVSIAIDPTFSGMWLNVAGIPDVADGKLYNRTINDWVEVSAPADHFKGSYQTEAALTAAWPIASDGDYAYIGTIDVPAIMWIWDNTDSMWVATAASSEPAELTPQLIKGIYESNPNTNAYTDTEKNAVATINNKIDKNTKITDHEQLYGKTADGLYTIVVNKAVEPISNSVPSRTIDGKIRGITTGTMQDELVNVEYLNNSISAKADKPDGIGSARVVQSYVNGTTAIPLSVQSDASTASGNIPLRNGAGDLAVPAVPGGDLFAASKIYVDNKFAAMDSGKQVSPGGIIWTWEYRDGYITKDAYYKMANSPLVKTYNTFTLPVASINYSLTGDFCPAGYAQSDNQDPSGVPSPVWGVEFVSCLGASPKGFYQAVKYQYSSSPTANELFTVMFTPNAAGSEAGTVYNAVVRISTKFPVYRI